MHVKSITTLAVVATLSQQSLAFNSHRHLHRREVEKREVAMDYVTVWETVYVTESEEPQPTKFVANGRPVTLTTYTTTTMMPEQEKPSPEPQAPPAPEPEQAPAAPPAPVPEQAPPAPPPSVQEPPPPPPQTTLATAVKPAPPAPAASSAAPPPPPAPKEEPQSSAPAPAASSSPSSNTKSPGAGVFAAKRGLAYNDGNLANVFGNSCKQCTWAYNWASSRQGLDSSVSFVPMLWGDMPTHTSHWDSDVEKALASGTKALFSFNEPDIKGQANLSPSQAAASHVKYMNKYAGRALVGAPSVSNSNLEGEGLAWLKSFMSACENQQEKCQVDFCNVHWYAPASAADTLFDHLEQAHQACGGRPVWLTEFAPVGDPAQTPGFLQTVMPKLEQLSYVDAYSYFMVSSGNLMSSATDLSSFGKVYATL